MIERFRKVEGMKVEGMESPDDRKVEHFCCCHSLLFSIEKYCRRRSAIADFSMCNYLSCSDAAGSTHRDTMMKGSHSCAL
jgi:hypothetical protein